MSRHQQKRDVSLSQHGSNSSAGLVDKPVIEQGAVQTLLVDEPQCGFNGGRGADDFTTAVVQFAFEHHRDDQFILDNEDALSRYR